MKCEPRLYPESYMSLVLAPSLLPRRVVAHVLLMLLLLLLQAAAAISCEKQRGRSLEKERPFPFRRQGKKEWQQELPVRRPTTCDYYESSRSMVLPDAIKKKIVQMGFRDERLGQCH